MDEQAAFAAFFQEHYPTLLRSAERRLSSREDARDAAAETFMIAWRKYDPQEPFRRVWLYKTLWNVVGSMYRRSSQELDLLRQLKDQEAHHAQDSTATEIIGEAMDQLSAKDREVLRLTYWEGLSASEIAIVVGGSEQATWKRISRARAAVRDSILRSGVRPAAGVRFDD
ncbi:RNA polymerase sigma factor [Agromyces sp. NPDC058126]|uniref:RNA polymerase sigma factor n=1 Tax=Agromyces sp. NPDC058126 TaxID=3346350 RepID=UPI0036DC5493